MKYSTVFYDSNEKQHTVDFSCRVDARQRTIFEKAVNETAIYMRKKKIVSGTVSYVAEFPNIWTNGGIGFIAINNIPVSLISENGCMIAN